MQALVKAKAGPGAEIMSVNVPAIGAHEVLVKVKAVSICGTDYHIYSWDRWAASRVKPPLIIGHEMAGEIVRIGPAVNRFKQGDYVSLECHKTCGQCYQCRTGQAHICCSYTILGVDFDGCFAEYVAVPEECLWNNSPDLPPEVACLQDPIGNAILAVLNTEVTAKMVLISGCGAIGLFAVGIARKAGAARVYAVDINEYRLGLAKKMGAHILINPLKEPVSEMVFSDMEGRCGVDIAVEMSGKESSLHGALKAVRNGGRVVLFGIPDDKIRIDLANDVIFKGITIAGITGREIYKTWYKTEALLNGVLDVSPVITHKMKLAEYAEAFEIIKRGECGKIILYP